MTGAGRPVPRFPVELDAQGGVGPEEVQLLLMDPEVRLGSRQAVVATEAQEVALTATSSERGVRDIGRQNARQRAPPGTIQGARSRTRCRFP